MNHVAQRCWQLRVLWDWARALRLPLEVNLADTRLAGNPIKNIISSLLAVLFSIEVTTTYFAVRNYWRGFFGCVVGASAVRLLSVWFQGADTVHAVYPTYISTEFPFDSRELIFFALTG